MLTKDELTDYWKNPTRENLPEKYLPNPKTNLRSLFLVELIKKLDIKKDEPILELGCNVGRNLYFIWKDGFRNLHGFDVNERAVQIMKKNFPEMDVDIFVGTIEKHIKQIHSMKLIFTVATLMHLHTSSEFVFSEMVEKGENIITIEDEQNHHKGRLISRDYANIFEGLGMKCVFSTNPVPGMTGSYIARVFSK